MAARIVAALPTTSDKQAQALRSVQLGPKAGSPVEVAFKGFDKEFVATAAVTAYFSGVMAT